MTYEDVFEQVAMNKKSVSKTVTTVLKRAQLEKRLTSGLLPAIKLLELDPDSVLFCILPQDQHGDATLHIQSVLLQAFCYENDIHIIKVDSAQKLKEIVTHKSKEGLRMDTSCVLVHKPWATDHQTPTLTEQERQLVNYSDQMLEAVPQPIIKLPVL